MDDEMPTNGVVLRPVFGQQGVLPDRCHFDECRHQQYEINETARTVACVSCRCALDPFQVLLEYARKERRFRHWDTEASRKLRALSELQDEERKVKSRTAAASRKDANVAVEHERRKNALRRHEIARKAEEIARLSARILRLSGVDMNRDRYAHLEEKLR